MKLLPAILTNDVEVVKKQIRLVQEYLPEAQVVQIDVTDGDFAEMLSVTPGDLMGIEWGEINLEFHLMTNEPLDVVNEILEVGRELPTRGVVGQIEHMSDVGLFLEEVAQKGWRAGVSLDLYTPVEEIDWEWVNFGLKTVQLMGVEAGAQGQQMNDLVLEKIIEVKEKIDELGMDENGLELWVDGGVKKENLEELKEAGVDGVVMGSGLWDSFK